MKRTILSLLVFFVTTMSWADNITAQEALQQAQSFIKQREDAGTRPKRVKGSASTQLTMVKQVSGLYLFNVKDNGGFVIVSNDDSTVPILGFSDSGAIDPDNMPSNMRAWLQGYADEIEWAKKHIIATPLKAMKASNAGAVKAPRRVGSHSTAAIAPLVTTKWDQDSPYNDLCPEYSSGYKSATGCVATAMAQVMKYHEWPKSATSSIPSYYCYSLGKTLSSLPATTFNWANMLDEYSYHWTGSGWQRISDGTTAQRTAVATLMKYCGWSVEMDYGEQSGSNTDYVANALKNYYSYNATTTQCVKRGDYSAAKWADLIYYELAHQRPVVYGGQSTGGGHEFVCDGYMYESSTDFFHINWGWGGMSDDYFVLSALDPDAQGIGGSTSTDGFRTGQDAVIGVQPSTSDVPIADITPNTISLTLNSLTLSRNPAFCNMPIDITLNITNNSLDDYEGPVFVGRVAGSQVSFLVGDEFVFPAGQTIDVVIPFTPTAAGTYNLIFMNPSGGGYYNYNIKKVLATLEVLADPAPTDLAVTPAATSATVSWAGYADSYEVRYAENSQSTEIVSTWLQYDDGEYATNLGTSSSASWTWGVKYPGSQVTGNKLTKVSWHEVKDCIDGDITVNIYSGGDDAPGTLLYTFTATPVKANGFHEVTLDSPVTITPWENLWITLTATGTYPISTCSSSETNNQWILGGSSWTSITNFGVSGLGWMIRGCMETAADDIEWKTVTSNTTSCELTGLTPETNYIVQVRGLFDTFGYTNRTTTTFTTLEQAFVTGDANGDGKVTITDAVAIVNYILGNPSADFNKDAADVSGDGNITITDAVGVVNIILNSGGGSAPALDLKEPEEADDAEAPEATEPE